MSGRSCDDGTLSRRLGRWLYRALELNAANAAGWGMIDARLTDHFPPAAGHPSAAYAAAWQLAWRDITDRLADVERRCDTGTRWGRFHDQ